MKKAKKILTIVAMTFVASVSCYADKYCEGSTERCPENTICGEIGEIEINEDSDGFAPWEQQGLTYIITGTGNLACFRQEEGEYVYIDGKYVKFDEEVGRALGNSPGGYLPYNKVQSTIPLTDAILPLTLALGVYGWVIRRRQKKHRG